MRDLKERFRSIDWRRGNGMMLLSSTTALIGMVFILLLIEFNGVYITGAVAQTRADAIADSAASYSITYDDSGFNHREAYEMAALLLAYNNSELRPITAEVEVLDGYEEGEPVANKYIRVAVHAESTFYFIDFEGDDSYSITRESIVEAVPLRDTFVVG